MPNTYLVEDEPVGIEGLGAVSQPGTLAITNDKDTTGILRHSRFRGGTFTVPAGVTGVTFTFYTRSRPGGSLMAAYSDAQPPVAVVRTVAASRSYAIPADIVGAYEIAIVSNVAGPETIEVNVKME